MASNFPTSLDDFTNYVDGTTVMEAAILNNMQAAIEAIEAKVGITDSAVTASHDYQLAHLPAFGDWISKDSGGSVALAKNEVYKVGSDGFVIAWQPNQEDLKFYTDGSNPPTTALQGAGFQIRELMRPVRKDDYWKIVSSQATVTIYWLPMGSGGCVKQ